jgi:hypothetical protein
VNILLFSEDTKSKRAESFRVPEELLPYLLRYLKEFRLASSVGVSMRVSGHLARAVR